VRLFVALDLREEVRQVVRELIARLKPASRSARWVPPESMHMTLKFIGYAAPEKLEAILSALAPIRSPRPVELHFRGIGFFPDEKRPRVIWCGMEASANLASLAADVERALEPLGIAPESRDFVPHLTLARFNAPEKSPELVRIANELQSRELGSASENEFHLFESVLHRSGAEYRKLASYPFVQGAA
jgi:RNA 2',3'-cyclic 3'-phosphodiesterase